MGSRLGKMSADERHCQSPQLMNVLSLPDEMLASVLKYNSFEDLTAVRKVSSKIDSVARRYGLDKLKVDRLRIKYNGKEVEMWIEILKHGKEFTHPLSTDLLDILKYYFSKIRGVKYLDLYNFSWAKMSISNEVGEFLLGNGCRTITSLDIYRWDISINFNTMRRIMIKLKPKELYIKASFTEFEFIDTLIEGISFDVLNLSSEVGTAKPIKLSLPYLARLCTLKIPSILDCTIYISTVSDLITFFKVWTKDMIYTIKVWRIDISKGIMPVDEAKQYLAKLKCFEDCTVAHSKFWDITSFDIRQKNGTRTNYWDTLITLTVLP